MFIFKNLLIWLVAIVWLAGVEILKIRPELWWIFLIIILLGLFGGLWAIAKRKINNAFWHFLILPASLILCGLGLSLFLVNDLGFHVTAVLTATGLYLLLRQYDLYFNQPFKYQPYSLEGLSWYISLLASFFLFVGLFASVLLVHFNLLYVLLILAALISLMLYQFFWIHKIDFSQSGRFIGIIVLILIELFAAVSFLPTSHMVNGLILTMAFYLMAGLSRFFLLGSLTPKRVLTYCLVAIVGLAAVLLTAQWS